MPNAATAKDVLDLSRRARELAANGDAEGALALWREALTLDPTSGQAHRDAGRLLLAQGRLLDAIPHLRAHAEQLGMKVRPWKLLAFACERAGEKGQAVVAWRRLLRFDPANEAAHAHLKAIALGPGHEPDAGLSPDQRRRKARAVKLLVKGNAVAAEEAFAHLALGRPDHPNAWMGLRGALHAQGFQDRAQAVGDDWIAADPRSLRLIDAAMARPLSRRGLIMDPREPAPVRSKEEALTRVDSAEALRGADDSYLVIDPGGQALEYSTVIGLEPDGSDLITARRTTVESFVISLKDAMVVGQGVAVTRSGTAIGDVLKFKMPKVRSRLRDGQLTFDRELFRDGACGVKYFDRPALLLAGGNDRSFGDWIDDYPPKLALAEAAGLDFDVVIRSDPIPQFVEMLEALGVKRERMLLHDADAVSVFPRLYVASWPVVRHNPMAGIFDVYRRAARPPPRERPRLYLSRAGVSKRPLVNEPEVRERFVRRGFQVVHPETLSFAQQLELFAGPACLAGPFGSAFHNLVFSSLKPACLLLMPPFFESYMDEIAFFFGLWESRFAYVRGFPTAGPGETDPMAPWAVPIDRVEAGIEKLLEVTAV